MTPLQKLRQWHHEQTQKQEKRIQAQQAQFKNKAPLVICSLVPQSTEGGGFKIELYCIPTKTAARKQAHTIGFCLRGKKGRKYKDGRCNICGGRPNVRSYIDENGDKFTWYDTCI